MALIAGGNLDSDGADELLWWAWRKCCTSKPHTAPVPAGCRPADKRDRQFISGEQPGPVGASVRTAALDWADLLNFDHVWPTGCGEHLQDPAPRAGELDVALSEMLERWELRLLYCYRKSFSSIEN